jgi:hypothetical protein
MKRREGGENSVVRSVVMYTRRHVQIKWRSNGKYYVQDKLVVNPGRKKPPGRTRHMRVDKLKLDLREIECGIGNE